MSAEPIDFAAVKVAHRGNEIENCGADLFCLECDVEWPCEPYRLSDAGERLAGKIARVRHVVADHDSCKHTPCQVCAALADQAEQVQQSEPAFSQKGCGRPISEHEHGMFCP